MKIMYVLIISSCVFSLIGNKPANPSKINQEQLNYEKLPDDVRDSLLLTHGINILSTVGKIFLDQALLDKHNPKDVAQNKQKIIFNLSFILECLSNFIYVLVRKPTIHESEIDTYESSYMKLPTLIYVHHLLKYQLCI